jgi:CRISPR-associated protein Csm1
MSYEARTEESCRVALAAFLHDLGKFAERARITQAREKDADGNTRQAVNEGLYCPTNNEGRRTHIHAAYTAIALDLLEEWLPEITGHDMSPFAPWGAQNVDDSLINAAAKHHQPDTCLQWIIATADRLASGFEREEFESYNSAPDEHVRRGRKLNHYSTRQETLLERIRIGSRAESSDWRYPLRALSPESAFPVPAAECENDDDRTAQGRYLTLWNQFLDGVKRIPPSHRASLALWLDHFDSLWLTFTHAVPSATAGIGGNVRPDVSLYDHSKTTAALAVALWRYHDDRRDDPATVREQLRAQWDIKRAASIEAREVWDAEKFLLVQGDFTGIQNFIFAEGGSTQKRAAKLLRGRSFYVSLLTDLAALKVLEALDLPATSQVLNAAGKFLIVAPNTDQSITKLHTVQAELDDWFLKHTCGQSGLGLAWLPAQASDFRHGQSAASPFRVLMRRLFEQLQEVKLRRFGLCGPGAADAVFAGFLDRFEHGECRIDGRSPGTVELESHVWVSELAADQIDTGKWLATQKRVLVTKETLDHNSLRLPVFGYCVNFTESEEDTGRFGDEARNGNLRRAWDFSLPESGDAPLWNGYARRSINAHVPVFTERDLDDTGHGKYDGLDEEDRANERPDAPKTLNHLARDDRKLDGNNRWTGVEALMTMKGDIDNLGLVFEKGLERPTFARMAAMSRQVNAFFTVYLPWLCRQEFPNVYTVFAGGDDFFLIGAWHSTIELASRMRKEFARFAAGNPDIHFSAGLSITKPGLPIRQLAALAEEALDEAKALPGKNAVSCFGQPVSWENFDDIMKCVQVLERAAREHNLSTGYLYALLRYTEMAAELREKDARPQAAMWLSQFAYRTRRLTETRYREVENRDERERRRQRLQTELGADIAHNGIQRHGASYKIALFTYLYRKRD